jgi:N6-adenosine-specific RNA methylase IME4
MLAEATTIEDILHVENLAQRARDFADAAGMGREACNAASTIMLDARRKAGDTLQLMKERGELAERGRPEQTSQAATYTLESIGLTRSQSSRYQQEASVPEEEYQTWLTGIVESGDRDLTASGLRKLVKRKAAKQVKIDESPSGVVGDLKVLIEDEKKYRCIYADPPWQYGNQGTRAATDDHYPTMTVPEICAEPIAELSDDCCLLYLWTTSGFLRESFEVIDAWGFTYKSNMVWVKPQMGIGNYVRLSHEHLMIATRGGMTTWSESQMSWVSCVEANRTKHSEKPDIFRKIIEDMSDGPFLELYGRKEAAGWTVYGNNVDRMLIS